MEEDIKRAIYLLRVAAAFAGQREEGTVYYDVRRGVSFCLAGDCAIAADALEGVLEVLRDRALEAKEEYPDV